MVIVGRNRTVDTDLNLPEGIRKGKTPGTWEVRIALPPTRDADGRLRQHQKSRTVQGGIRDAKRARADLLSAREQQGGSAGTFAAHLAWWLDSVEPQKSPNTMRNYRAYTIRYINPALGHVQLRKLTTRMLDDFYGDLRRRGLAPSTIRQCHSIIRKALSDAVRHSELPVNPAVAAEPPKLVRHEIEPPGIAAYQAIYERAQRGGSDGLGNFLRVAAGTGARRAEVCGLRWSDIDFGGRSILIARSIIEVKRDGRNVLEVHTTKTKKPRRISIDPIVADSLAAHLTAMHARAKRAGLALLPDAYIFSDELDGSAPWRPGRITTAFYRLRKELGLNVRLHDLRHMHATQLLASGIDVRTVAGRLGHSNPNVTLNVYAHFVPAADRAAADLLGDLLHGSQPAALPAADPA